MAFAQTTINSTDPLDTEEIEQGAARIRNLAAAVKERLASAFVAPDTDPMVLKRGSMPTDIINLTLSGILAANSAAIVGAITGASIAVSTTATVGMDLDVGGDATIVGALIAASLAGDGSAITNLDASELTGTLPVLDGSGLTDLNAAELTTGFVHSDRMSGLYPGILIPNGNVQNENPIVIEDAVTHVLEMSASGNATEAAGGTQVSTGSLNMPASMATLAGYRYLKIEYDNQTWYMLMLRFNP